MKLLSLLSLYLLLAFSTHAQALSWLHGNWTGETYFPNGPVTKRIIVNLHITKVTGNHFEALLDNLYPNDTTVRLERKIKGSIINKKMRIESSEQVYIRDPRTQNFWRDCTGCEVLSAFSIGDEQVEIKLKTTSCSDECNGETIFSRDTSELNPSQQKDLTKWFHLPASEPTAKADKPQVKDSSAAVSALPDHKTAALTVQHQELNIKDSSVSASETSDNLPAGSLQEQGKNAKDNSPETPDTQTETENKENKQARHSDSVLPEKPGGSMVSASVKLQKPVSDTSKTRSVSETLKPPSQRKPSSRSVKKKDTLAATATNSLQANKGSIAKLKTPVADSTPSALTTRTTTLVNTFQVSSPHIVIQLFDNAEIDGDVVTVYHNGQMIVNRQSLTHKAITITIDASKENAHHEFIMVADNLGLIPPNTALMRITAGGQKFELEVSSDFDNNSKITIDYTGE